MNKDMLYDAAFRYKKTALWKKLWDDEIFAIKLSSGEIGYICVMGKSGDYCSLALYIGEEGFQSYRQLGSFTGYEGSEFMAHEQMLQQKCLQLVFDNKDALSPDEIDEAKAYGKAHGIKFSGKNSYPQFVKFEPNFHPWHVQDEDDMQALHEALEAAILMADLLDNFAPFEIGIYDVVEDTEEVVLFEIDDGELVQSGMAPIPLYEEKKYELVKVTNDIAIKALSKLPKKGIWETELVRLMDPVQLDPEEAPYYPLLMLMVDSKSYYILPVSVILDKDNDTDKFLQEYVEAWKSQRTYAREIRCRDQRTYAFLKDISEKTGVKISIYDEEMDALDEAEYTLLDDGLAKDSEDAMMELAAAITTVLDASIEEVRMMPKQLIDELTMMINNEWFPREIARELRKKLARI